jgi:hypothetical protein
MTRDELYSLRRGCTLRRVQQHDSLPELAVYVDWNDERDAYRRVIRDPEGHEHTLSDRELCSLYEPASN